MSNESVSTSVVVVVGVSSGVASILHTLRSTGFTWRMLTLPSTVGAASRRVAVIVSATLSTPVGSATGPVG